MASHATSVWRLAVSGLLLLSAARPMLAYPCGPVPDQQGTVADPAAEEPDVAPDLRVGAISIQVFDVFDVAATGASSSLYRAANLLHARTRSSVVQRELLFEPGDRFDAETLRQSERNLRALGLFRRVEVRALPPSDGEVAVEVRVYDAWSLTSGTSFRHEGGVSAYSARFREGNVAGLGVALSMRYSVGFERNETDWSFADPRLFGSRERVSVAFASRSDGDAKELSLARPFYALSAPSAHAASWRSARETYRTYEDGRVHHEYGLLATDAAFGWAGRAGAVRQESVWRIAAGYRFAAREYSLVPGAETGAMLGMPTSYRRGGPYAGVQFLRHRYETRTGILAPDREVDFNLGLNVNADIFVSSPFTGPDTQNRVVAALAVGRGWRLPRRGLVLAEGRAGGEGGGGMPARGDLAAILRLWMPHSETRVTALLCEGRALLNPDRGTLLYLGGTPGLRGYRENQFAGTRSFLAIVEERRFLAWRPAGLVQPGFAIFAEVGALAGTARGRGTRALYGDVGAGLRLVRLKSAGSDVVKVDLAIPVGDGWRGGRAVQLVVGFRREL